jgi:phenylacetyl-CoA:acceptor oxidoreductase subunit 1
MMACKMEHFLPPDVFWNRVLITEVGTFPNVTKEICPVICNHCKEAPCVKVCPSAATTRRDDGIVIVDYDKCIGCRYCVIACPYQQRVFLADGKKEYFPGQGFTEYELIGKRLYPLQKGTTVKCNFCVERIDEGLKKGLKPGVDWEATPACVNACPSKARFFGDLEDPESKVSKVIRERKGSQLHTEYGTDPSIYYLKY